MICIADGELRKGGREGREGGREGREGGRGGKRKREGGAVCQSSFNSKRAIHSQDDIMSSTSSVTIRTQCCPVSYIPCSVLW